MGHPLQIAYSCQVVRNCYQQPSSPSHNSCVVGPWLFTKMQVPENEVVKVPTAWACLLTALSLHILLKEALLEKSEWPP